MNIFINTTFRSLDKDPGAITANSLFQGLLKFAPYVATLSQNSATPNLVASLLTKFKALAGPANVALTIGEQTLPVGQVFLFNNLGQPLSFAINRLKSVLTLQCHLSNGGAISPVPLDSLLKNDGNGVSPLLRSMPRPMIQVVNGQNINTITSFSDTSLENNGALQNVPIVTVQNNGGDDPSWLANCNRLFFSTGNQVKKIGSAGWMYELKGLTADQITALAALRTAYGARLLFSASVCNYYSLEVEGNQQADGSNPEIYIVVPSEWGTKAFPSWVSADVAGTIADVTIQSAPGFTTAANGFTEALVVPLSKIGGSQSTPVSKQSDNWSLTAAAAGPTAIAAISMESSLSVSINEFIPRFSF